MRHLEQAGLFLAKAAEDEALLAAAADKPELSSAIYGFHCQQAVEKLLKALLSARQIAFGRSHDLAQLGHLVESHGCPLPEDWGRLEPLTAFAVRFRYELLDVELAVDRVATLQAIRELRLFVEAEIRKPSASAPPHPNPGSNP
jgi:HEPN domain-containing protein